jgi:hypothetical protein
MLFIIMVCLTVGLAWDREVWGAGEGRGNRFQEKWLGSEEGHRLIGTPELDQNSWNLGRQAGH